MKAPNKRKLPYRRSFPVLGMALLLVGGLVLGSGMAQAQLWGSSSKGSVPNPSSLFTIDATTGAATLVGSTGLGNGLVAIKFDPTSGTLYGMLGSACSGARLITVDKTTGAGTLVGVLVGSGFDGTSTASCDGGSDSIAVAPDGTLYAGGWNGGTGGPKILTVDKSTGAVLANHPTGLHQSGLAFDSSGVLWASHGNNAPGQLHTLDPTTGAYPTVLILSDFAVVANMAFAPDGTLFASLPAENMLATIDTTTGVITRIGSYGGDVSKMSGLAFETNQITALSDAHLWIGLRNSDDQGTQFDLRTELLKNGTPVASGLKRCITGVTRNPTKALLGVVPWDSFAPVSTASGDVLALRVSTRVGTNPDDTKCAGPGGSHNSAVGLRLYYDSTSRDSHFDATISPNPNENLYLHSNRSACHDNDGESTGAQPLTLDNVAPASATSKCKDSGVINFRNGNPFATIGTWSLAPLP